MRTINRYVVATGLLLVRANAGSRRRLDVVVEPWRAALLMYGGHCTHVRTPARTSIVVASVVVFTATAAVDVVVVLNTVKTPAPRRRRGR